MDEKEVKKLEDYILETPDDSEFKLEWAKKTLENFTIAEKKLRYEFTLFKFLRDDEKLNLIKKDMEKTRSVINFVKEIIDNEGK